MRHLDLLFVTALAVPATAQTAPFFTTYEPIGDSITAQHDPSTPANLYRNKIAADLHLTQTSYAGNGETSCDAIKAIFKNIEPTETNNALHTVLLSTNDAWRGGVGPYETVFNFCHRAILSWLTIPSTYKVAAESATTHGSCSNDLAYAPGVIGKACTSDGATVTLAIKSYGHPVFLWRRIYDGDAGTYSCSIDGGEAQALTTTTDPTIGPACGSKAGVAAVRFAVTKGKHTITCTKSGAAGTMNIVAVGTPSPNHTATGPRVYVGGTPYEMKDYRSEATARYNELVKENVAAARADGMDAYFVDVEHWMTGTAEDMANTLHPNDKGEEEIKEAFESVIYASAQGQSSGASTH